MSLPTELSTAQHYEMSELLEKEIRKIVGSKLSESEMQQLLLEISTRRPSLAVRENSVAIAGNVANATILNGDRNILFQNSGLDTAVIDLLKGAIVPGEIENVVDSEGLVQKVRSHLHDDIHRLHGTMPLWAVDYCVPLGDLFISVNILESISRNQRLELTDLWKDFKQSPNARGLDRVGIGKERQRVPGLEVLSSGMNLVVVGKPGSGKSTYLQRVVTECNAGNLQTHRVPALIRLRDFVDDGRELGYSIEDYLEQCWRLSKVETALILNDGKALVLLDGLDEAVGEDGQAIAKQIKRFSRTYPQVQIVVTCRTQSQESKFERFNYVEVADFDEAQVRAFSKHWFQAVCSDVERGESKAQAFLEQLFRAENQLIRELATTPILLSLTCAVFHQKGKFYSRRSKLYEEGLWILLEQWDREREVERDEIYRDLSVEKKLALLSYLALKKFEHPQYVLFEQNEVESYIAEFLSTDQRSAQSILKSIEAQHGLLIERSHGVWSFSHLTFQEYFVATEIGKWQKAQSDVVLTQIEAHLHDSRWSEVLLLLIAQQEEAQAAKALNAILTHHSLYEQWLFRNLLFAGRALAESISIEPEDAVPVLQKLIDLSFDESFTVTKKTRQLAKNVLCSMRSTSFAPIVLQLLNKIEPSLTYWEHIHYRIALDERAKTIAFLEDRVRRLANDIDNQLSPAIALLEIAPCSKVGEDGLLNVIKGQASADCWYEGVGNYVQAISRFSDRFIDELLSLAKLNTIFYVDLSHFFSFLCGISERMLNGQIALTTHENENVKAHAIEVLVDYCTLGRASKAVKDRVSRVLVQAFKDDSSRVRASGVYGLQNWELDEFLKPLIDGIKALLTDPDRQVQYTAATTLVNLGMQGEGSVEIIIEGLEKIAQDIDSGQNIERQARTEYWLPGSAYTGSHLLNHSEDIASRLEGLLECGDPIFQSNILKILSNLSLPSQSLVDRIHLLTKSTSDTLRTPAMNAWAKLHVNRQKSLGELEQCLLHEVPEVKAQALAVIEKEQIVSSQVTALLKPLIKDPAVRVQLAAIKTLSALQISDTPTLVSLLPLLEYEGPQSKAPAISNAAEKALIELGRSNLLIIAPLVDWIEEHTGLSCVGSGINVLRGLSGFRDTTK